MDRDFLIQLTNNLYRLTLLFPKKEPLRYKIREVADEILVKPAEKNLEILDSFFEVAKSQNWVKATDILAVQEKYDNLKRGLKKGSPEKKKVNPVVEAKPRPIEIRPQTLEISSQVVEASPRPMPERQEKILAFLKENGQAQVWQVKQILPEVTKRTLRRDFDQMLKQGTVKRIGERNNTFYQLKTTKV